MRAGGASAEAFRAADPDLDGYLIVDFDGFDEWFEEDERNVGHPRDPFHRIDIVHGSRHVVVTLGGEVVADSSSPCLLFEPPIPPRYYLPREDVRMDLLTPSDKRTFCAYKGEASYLSHADEPDVAWYYPAPLREAAEVTDRVAFFNELADIDVDGERLERPDHALVEALTVGSGTLFTRGADRRQGTSNRLPPCDVWCAAAPPPN